MDEQRKRQNLNDHKVAMREISQNGLMHQTNDLSRRRVYSFWAVC